jgi:hypothetical protein
VIFEKLVLSAMFIGGEKNFNQVGFLWKLIGFLFGLRRISFKLLVYCVSFMFASLCPLYCVDEYCVSFKIFNRTIT